MCVCWRKTSRLLGLCLKQVLGGQGGKGLWAAGMLPRQDLAQGKPEIPIPPSLRHKQKEKKVGEKGESSGSLRAKGWHQYGKPLVPGFHPVAQPKWPGMPSSKDKEGECGVGSPMGGLLSQTPGSWTLQSIFPVHGPGPTHSHK